MPVNEEVNEYNGLAWKVLAVCVFASAHLHNRHIYEDLAYAHEPTENTQKLKHKLRHAFI